MRLVLTITIFLITLHTYSQQQKIDSIPGAGISLDKNWRFTAGDNSDFANPGYNDSAWQAATLADFTPYLTRLQATGIGWFRLHIVIDPVVQNGELVLQISQLGASEIYINGALFQRLGSISAPNGSRPLNPGFKPFLIPEKISGSTIIAVRFASKIPADLSFFTRTKKLPFSLIINNWNNGLSVYKFSYQKVEAETKFSYLYVALSFLFLLLYIFFPRDKLNLLFGVFCFFAITRTYLVYHLADGSFTIENFGRFSYLLDLNDAVLGILNISLICYAVLKRVSLYFWILILGISADLLLILFSGPTLFQVIFDFIFHALTVIGFFYLSVLAFRKRIFTIGTVAFICTVLNMTFFLFFFHLDIKPLNSITDNDYVRYALTVNFIMTTIYVAINSARKSKNLEVQVVEIDKLSQDNLKKEQEKQYLLASQNATLEHQVSQRTEELTQSLENLKSTQAQLIQSEKMASLGELTAGIAHEIQNPLNFVNNFSDLNKELLEELKSEADKGNVEQVKAIANDVIANEEKVNHHGKRADDIVKGMLQHSHQKRAVRESADINALCDECLKLSYHNLRAKDRNFNPHFETYLDQNLATCSIVPQNIRCVLLNLFNNAFYAVHEKSKQLVTDYTPLVSVSTRQISDAIEIIISDNGTGIPPAVIDKIFQPFFTTKPAGAGTGLGLSLAYDIITKEHSGSLKVKSKAGEGSDFIIAFSCSNQHIAANRAT